MTWKNGNHKLWKSFIFGAALALLTACQPKSQDTCGFVENVYGERITWKTKDKIELHISSTVPAQLKGAIYRAAQTWETRMGKQIFQIKEDSTGSLNTPKKDGKNTIYYLSNWESNRRSEQGRTSVYWANNQIIEADIRLNGFDFSYYNEDKSQLVTGAGLVHASSGGIGYSFEALVLHELGHFLGLKHTEDHGSVMATHLAANTDRTQPSAYDTHNIQCAY